MKTIKLSLLSALSATLILAGCTESKRDVDLHLTYITAHSAPIMASDRNAQAEVAEAATNASGSLDELSAIDLANSSPATRSRIQAPWNAAAIGMTQLASVDWNGPIEPFLNKIAAATGYHLRILGIQPPIPVLVIINAQNEMLADILRDAMYQVHNKASIKVYPKARVLELRYFPS